MNFITQSVNLVFAILGGRDDLKSPGEKSQVCRFLKEKEKPYEYDIVLLVTI